MEVYILTSEHHDYGDNYTHQVIEEVFGSKEDAEKYMKIIKENEIEGIKELIFSDEEEDRSTEHLVAEYTEFYEDLSDYFFIQIDEWGHFCLNIITKKIMTFKD